MFDYTLCSISVVEYVFFRINHGHEFLIAHVCIGSINMNVIQEFFNAPK